MNALRYGGTSVQAGLLAAVLCFSTRTQAQWVAFNDHVAGPGTHPNATRYASPAIGLSGVSSGPLTNIATGAQLPVTLRITTNGVLATASSVGAVPGVGTPAYNVFNGFVDFGSVSAAGTMIQTPLNSTVTYTFTGLDVNKTYKFHGSAVRGGAGGSYTNRWEVFSIVGAVSFVNVPTPGCVTSAQEPGDIQPNQVVFCSGTNTNTPPAAGEMAEWDNIVPGPGGTFSVTSTRYAGALPSPNSAIANSPPYGYALTGIRLEEIASCVSPVAPTFGNVDDPTNRTAIQCGSTAFSASAIGCPPPTYQWYKNDESHPIADQTNAIYTISSVQPADAGDYFVRATNPTGFIDSHKATLTVSPAPPFNFVRAVATDITVAGGIQDTNRTRILISFSAPVDPATVFSAGFTVKDRTSAATVEITSATVTSGTNILLVTAARAEGTSYDVIFNAPGVANPCLGSRFTGSFPMALPMIVLEMDDAQLWRYNTTGIDPGPVWLSVGYDDSGWPQGLATFDAKSTGPRPACGNPNAGIWCITNTPIRTILILTNNSIPIAAFPTYNFRTHINLASIPSLLQVITFWDDGGAIFINGNPIGDFRLRDAATNRFGGYSGVGAPSGDALYEGPFDIPTSNLVVGDNLIAVELKQVNATGSDITMGLRLLAFVTTSTAPPQLGFSSTDYTIGESAGMALISVTRSDPTNTLVSVHYATADDTAFGGVDYVPASGTLSFAPGETLKTFTVPILDDVIYEGIRSLRVGLSNPGGGAVLGSVITASVAIVDNESPAPAILSQPQSQTVVDGGSASFTVSAIGLVPLSYQWRLNGVTLPGATASNLVVLNAQATNAGTYSVVVSNSVGMATSGPAALNLTFTLNLSTDGNGTILPAPNLPSYALGSLVSLTAIPNFGYDFLNWTGDAGGSQNPLLVTMNTNRSIQARFISNLETNAFNGVTRIAPVGTPAIFVDGQFIVNAACTNRGSAEVSLWSSFTNGFITFTLNGSDPKRSASLYHGPFVVKKPSTIRALAYNSDFTRAMEADPVVVVLLPVMSASTPGGGTVSVDPPAGAYLSDSMARITATPAGGWTFLGWNGDASGTNPIATVRMSQDRCVEAVFGTVIHTTVAVGSGSMVIEPPAGLYPFGSMVRVSAVPQPSNYFGFWGEAASGTSTPLDFAVTNANPTIAAVFYGLSSGQYSLTVLPQGYGRVAISPLRSYYSSGQSVSLTAIADPGQEFIGWSGSTSGTINPVALIMHQSKMITANFTKRPHLAVAKCGGGGGVGPYQLSLTSPLGAEYGILTSSNLADWTSWITLTNSFGTLYFRDESATNNSQRFYRAVEP